MGFFSLGAGAAGAANDIFDQQQKLAIKQEQDADTGFTEAYKYYRETGQQQILQQKGWAEQAKLKGGNNPMLVDQLFDYLRGGGKQEDLDKYYQSVINTQTPDDYGTPKYQGQISDLQNSLLTNVNNSLKATSRGYQKRFEGIAQPYYDQSQDQQPTFGQQQMGPQQYDEYFKDKPAVSPQQVEARKKYINGNMDLQTIATATFDPKQYIEAVTNKPENFYNPQAFMASVKAGNPDMSQVIGNKKWFNEHMALNAAGRSVTTNNVLVGPQNAAEELRNKDAIGRRAATIQAGTDSEQANYQLNHYQTLLLSNTSSQGPFQDQVDTVSNAFNTVGLNFNDIAQKAGLNLKANTPEEHAQLEKSSQSVLQAILPAAKAAGLTRVTNFEMGQLQKAIAGIGTDKNAALYINEFMRNLNNLRMQKAEAMQNFEQQQRQAYTPDPNHPERHFVVDADVIEPFERQWNKEHADIDIVPHGNAAQDPNAYKQMVNSLPTGTMYRRDDTGNMAIKKADIP